MPPPSSLLDGLSELRAATGRDWQISQEPVPGTGLYVVHAAHEFPKHYTVEVGQLGFRVPSNFPDAGPEDCFFISPAKVKLREANKNRGTSDIHRAGENPGYAGPIPGLESVLVFSWHLWNKTAWNRRKNRLSDHYFHCLRRFEQAEND